MHSQYLGRVSSRRIGLIAILLICGSVAHADDPPADTKASATQQTKEAAEAVKHDAKAVGAAVKDGAQKVGVAAKEVALQVADTAKEGAHEVAVAAKTGVAKTKAAVSGDRAPAKPAAKPMPTDTPKLEEASKPTDAAEKKPAP